MTPSRHRVAPSPAPVDLSARTAPFLFQGPDGAIGATGTLHPLPRGPLATLPDRISRAMEGMAPTGLIGGALPFDRDADDCLWMADQTSRTPIAARTQPEIAPTWTVTPEPSAEAYAEAVQQALDLMKNQANLPQPLRKIVLARTLALVCDQVIPVPSVLARLCQDASVTAFQVALPPSTDTGPDTVTDTATDTDGARLLVGASPELLVRKSGAQILSHPLAGSARRRSDAAQDRAAAQALTASAKDLREHAIVVEFILDTLAPHCTTLTAPSVPEITSSATMWHLGTPIRGELRDADMPSVQIAGLLHPTPAVCGSPRDRAAQIIQQLEPVARDFYAGAVGWTAANGDGAWYVSIRCAEIQGRSARLYAGAGIVPGSVPAQEAAETGAKFAALLRALGLPHDMAIPTDPH
ncbi:isochorismate synthase [Pseudooceanicola sediminis]|uniref:isochorismate synthase n=1 Tax=Pseudooceanicola sediminis TaxID=2211117 RepID=A0A399IYW7_9RHOB|nr:isochorismate synthase [Pseudooceanicola sediminis]KAA2316043.1 isochorismate synthase [Puniceibacterium sp. HSS470]RII38154.1 isochorismate synthase [Pseudooceanicola sediminis]